LKWILLSRVPIAGAGLPAYRPLKYARFQMNQMNVNNFINFSNKMLSTFPDKPA